MKYKLLVVDDEIDNLQLLQRTFRRNYELFSAQNGVEGLEVLKENHVDCIISDQKMPIMDGIEFLQNAAQVEPEAVRILLTAYSDASMLIDAINKGKIYRYIKKPWNPEDLTKVVEAALSTYQLSKNNRALVKDFKELFSGTINVITEALDAKDSFTYGRSKRVTLYSTLIAKNLGLTPIQVSEIELAGLLHDIGMIGVPEYVINKPGNLSDEEFKMIQSHVNFGIKILEEIKPLKSVIEIIKYHHEKHNGAGYPYGIKGDEIPLGARIISISDAYDSMVSDRAYRRSLTHEEAVERIKSSADVQFDPMVVNGFLAIVEEANDILESEELLHTQEREITKE